MTAAPYLDIGDAPAEFRLAAIYAASLTPDLRRDLNTAVRQRVIPRAIAAYSRAPGASETGNRLPYSVVRTVKVTNRSGVITGLKFGSNKRLRGRGVWSDLLRPVEFGTSGTKRTTYWRVNAEGTRHKVRRKTRTAFDPPRPRGRVIWPATYQTVAPLVLAEYTAAVFDLVREAG